MKLFFALLCLMSFKTQAFDLRIASYNIKGLPFPIQTNHTPRYKSIVRELRAMDAQGKGPDVILVQESFSIFTKYLYRNLSDIYPYKVRGPGNRLRWNSGLEILSRYPFTRATTLAFSSCDSFDCLSRKGVLFVRIKLPQNMGEIDVYNTHMQADNKGRDDSISQRVRAQQTESMISFVKRTHNEKFPLFMGGDFNTRPQDASFSRFMEEFGDVDTSEFCRTRNTCAGYNLMPASYWSKKIDHLFYSQATPLDYEQFFNGTDYSDHDMLKGTYKIERAP